MKKILSMILVFAMMLSLSVLSFADGTWKCSNGHENPDTNLFCGKCGEKKPEVVTWTCSNGHENPAENSFCTQCGEKKAADANTVSASQKESAYNEAADQSDSHEQEQIKTLPCPDCAGEGRVSSSCTSCNGSGRTGSSNSTCSKCGGTGKVYSAQQRALISTDAALGSGNIDVGAPKDLCMNCFGTGKASDKCGSCKGTGKIYSICSTCQGSGVVKSDGVKAAATDNKTSDSVSPRQIGYNQLINAEIGDYVTFGSYEQDNNLDNGKEDIEWLVLDKEGNRLLVISKYALDCQPYNLKKEGVTWETCSLRGWLNETFLYSAFNEEEQSLIPTVTVDGGRNPIYGTNPGNKTQVKVFIISVSEANKYFESYEAMECIPTAYAIAQGASTSDTLDGVCYWWLRSPGSFTYLATAFSAVGLYREGYKVSSAYVGVRPALWIDIAQ